MIPDEIEFPPDFDNEIASDNNINHQLPCYNITNFPMTNLENDDPALLLLDENYHYNG